MQAGAPSSVDAARLWSKSRSSEFEALRDVAAILGEFEAADANAFADQAMRLGIAGHAADPLWANVEVFGCKPSLGKDLDHSCLGISHVHGGVGIVFRPRLVGTDEIHFVDGAELGRKLNPVSTLGKHAIELKIGDGGSRRIDAFRRLLEPSGHHFEF